MLDVRPLSANIGAEIYGLDLSHPSEQDMQQLRSLLNEHEVVFLRDQELSHEQHSNLAGWFGPVQKHAAYGTVAGFPEITILESSAEKPSKIEAWHSDMTFLQQPPMATLLRARNTPPRGGDTLWSSMTAACEGLSKPLRKMLEGLTAVHDFRHGFRESLAEPGGEERLEDMVRSNPPVRHPVIREHPETGKSVLFVNSLFTTHIEGLPRAESNALLAFLYSHVGTPEFCCRFHWEPGNIALWDNRSTQHKPVNDYFPEFRRMERSTIFGDKPYQ